MFKRFIGYWLKIVNMQDHRYKKCYLMLICYDEAGDSNWASTIRHFYVQTDSVTFGQTKGQKISIETQRPVLTKVARAYMFELQINFIYV